MKKCFSSLNRYPKNIRAKKIQSFVYWVTTKSKFENLNENKSNVPISFNHSIGTRNSLIFNKTHKTDKTGTLDSNMKGYDVDLNQSNNNLSVCQEYAKNRAFQIRNRQDKNKINRQLNKNGCNAAYSSHDRINFRMNNSAFDFCKYPCVSNLQSPQENYMFECSELYTCPQECFPSYCPTPCNEDVYDVSNKRCLTSLSKEILSCPQGEVAGLNSTMQLYRPPSSYKLPLSNSCDDCLAVEESDGDDSEEGSVNGENVDPKLMLERHKQIQKKEQLKIQQLQFQQEQLKRQQQLLKKEEIKRQLLLQQQQQSEQKLLQKQQKYHHQQFIKQQGCQQENEQGNEQMDERVNEYRPQSQQLTIQTQQPSLVDSVCIRKQLKHLVKQQEIILQQQQCLQEQLIKQNDILESQNKLQRQKNVLKNNGKLLLNKKNLVTFKQIPVPPPAQWYPLPDNNPPICSPYAYQCQMQPTPISNQYNY